MLKKNRILIKYLAFFLVVLFMISSTPQVKAEYWGSNASSAILKQVLEKIFKQIMDAMLGAAKQSAAQSVNESVDSAIGSGSSAQYITDWNDFLFQQPQEETVTYMNDFFSNSTGGQNSSLNYISNSSSGSGGNYMSQVQEEAKKYVLPQDQSSGCEISDSSKIFEDGTWKDFTTIISNPSCNKFSYTLKAQGVAMQKLAELEEQAKTMAISYQGYKGQGSKDQISTPGSLIKDMQADAKNIGNQIIGGATSVPEVITSLVTQMVTQTISQGIGGAQSSNQKQTNNQANGLNSFLDDQTNPGDRFKVKY